MNSIAGAKGSRQESRADRDAIRPRHTSRRRFAAAVGPAAHIAASLAPAVFRYLIVGPHGHAGLRKRVHAGERRART
jgi:hypothetical protein